MGVLTKLNRLPIKVKLWSGFIVLALITGFIYFLQLDVGHMTEKMVSVTEHERLLATDANAQMLQARRREKDFLLRFDLKYLGQVQQYTAEVTDLLQQIAHQSEDPARATMAKEAIVKVGQYEAAFKQVVDAYSNRGLSEKEGLRGALRDAVHKLEESLKTSGHDDLTVKMLMCRRHEKDYLLRGAAKYLDRVDARISEFEALVDQHGIDAQQKQAWMKLMKLYRDTLRELAGQDAKIASLTEGFRGAAHDADELVQAIRNSTAQAAQQAETEVMAYLHFTQMISLIAVGLVVVCGVVTSMVVIRSLLLPVQRITTRATQIAQRNFFFFFPVGRFQSR